MVVYEHELEEGDSYDTDAYYVLCFEEQTKTCPYPIMLHLFEQLEAYRKHVKRLEMFEAEEQHG